MIKKIDAAMTCMSVRLTQALIDALEKIGKQEDRPVSYLIRKAVEEFVATRGRTQ